MQIADLLKLGDWANARTRALIPYSRNFYNPGSIKPLHLGISVTLDRFHKGDPQYQPYQTEDYFPKVNADFLDIGIALVRCNAKDKKAKKVLNEIFQWHLNFAQTEPQHNLEKTEIWIESLQKYIPFSQIQTLIDSYNTKKQRDNLHSIETEAVRAIKGGAGNCSEVSAAAMLFLMEYPATGIKSATGIQEFPEITGPIRLERVGIPKNKGDHMFLLLNRTQGDLNDPLRWNDDTVICDPWTNETYTVKQLFENKTEEQKQKILNLFSNLVMEQPGSGYFLGDKANQRIHSEKWQAKHTVNNNAEPKFWRPAKLLGLQQRPQHAPKIPYIKLTFTDLLNILGAMFVEERIRYIEQHAAKLKPIVANVAEFNNLLSLFQKEQLQFVVKKFGFENLFLVAEKYPGQTGDDIVSGILFDVPKFFISVVTKDSINALTKEDNAATICAQLLNAKQPFCNQTGSELLAASPDLLLQMLKVKNKDGRSTLQELLRLNPECLSTVIKSLERASAGMDFLLDITPLMIEALNKPRDLIDGRIALQWLGAVFDYMTPNLKYDVFLAHLLKDNGVLFFKLATMNAHYFEQALEIIFQRNPVELLKLLVNKPDGEQFIGLQLLALRAPNKFAKVLQCAQKMTEERPTLIQALLASFKEIACYAPNSFPQTLLILTKNPREYQAIIQVLSKKDSQGQTVFHQIASFNPKAILHLIDGKTPADYRSALTVLLNGTDNRGTSCLHDIIATNEFNLVCSVLEFIIKTPNGHIGLAKALYAGDLALLIDKYPGHFPQVLECAMKASEGPAEIAKALEYDVNLLRIICVNAPDCAQQIIFAALGIPAVSHAVLTALSEEDEEDENTLLLIVAGVAPECIVPILEQAARTPDGTALLEKMFNQQEDGCTILHVLTFTDPSQLKALLNFTKQYNMLGKIREMLDVVITDDNNDHVGKNGWELLKDVAPHLLPYVKTLLSTAQRNKLFPQPGNSNLNQPAPSFNPKKNG